MSHPQIDQIELALASGDWKAAKTALMRLYDRRGYDAQRARALLAERGLEVKQRAYNAWLHRPNAYGPNGPAYLAALAESIRQRLEHEAQAVETIRAINEAKTINATQKRKRK